MVRNIGILIELVVELIYFIVVVRESFDGCERLWSQDSLCLVIL